MARRFNYYRPCTENLEAGVYKELLSMARKRNDPGKRVLFQRCFDQAQELEMLSFEQKKYIMHVLLENEEQ